KATTEEEMSKSEDENHDARKAANGELGTIGDHVDDLGTSHTNSGRLDDEVGGRGSEADKLDRFKDQLNDELDAIQTLINHNQIGPADRRLRELIRRVERVIESAGKALHKKMREAEKRFKAAKRGITEPAIPMDAVVAMDEPRSWGGEKSGRPPSERA
ncbi:MAG: hypothetical protein Q8O54_04305, partial [Brevundimonas sp.]|nr:hypothetical protein [Brevundimonas sp.]